MGAGFSHLFLHRIPDPFCNAFRNFDRKSSRPKDVLKKELPRKLEARDKLSYIMGSGVKIRSLPKLLRPNTNPVNSLILLRATIDTLSDARQGLDISRKSRARRDT
jgi:hypothetical protein